MRTRLKNVITGATVDRTFNPSDKMPKAHIDRRDMTYLYFDGELYHFMDSETFDQVPMNASTVGDTLKFVKENDTVKVLSFKGSVFGIEAATFVVLEIVETEPGFKGDTAQGATKPATVETGAVVKVPLFVESGEKIKIDTRTGEYLERA